MCLPIKFSIIMPVYNVEKYLDQAIQSIIKQTYTNWELIIINDGSNDNSTTICNNYGDKDKRIQIYHQENTGVSKSRNKALEKINGDYVGFVDSDDWVEESWLSKIVDIITEKDSEDPDLIVYGWIENYYGGKSSYQKIIEIDKLRMDNEQFKNYYIKKYNENKFAGFCWNKIYKKEILKNLKFREDFNIVEDEIFNYEVYKKAKNIILISDLLYHYRRTGEQSLTTIAKFNYKEDLYYTSKTFYKIINKFYEDWGIERNRYLYHIRQQYVSAMYDCIVNISLYESNHKEKFRKIDQIINDGYFQDALIDWKKIKEQNKALKIMCYIGKIKNKYIAYLIIRSVYFINNLKNMK